MQALNKIENRTAPSIPMRVSLYQRFIFFLLSVGLISFHRFIALEQESEDQLRSKQTVSTAHGLGDSAAESRNDR